MPKQNSAPSVRAHQANSNGKPTNGQPTDVIVETHGHDIHVTIDDRRYRVRGLEKNMSPHQLRVNILAQRDDLVHLDTLDLCKARSRVSFIKATASELYCDEQVIKKDVGRILLQLEKLQSEQIELATQPNDVKVELTPAEEHAALQFLRSPKLIDRILADYDTCGLVGEETNKLVCYLACVSRLLKEPLAILIQSGSAAGKTSLMDATLSFVPFEHQIRYSALTGQSLYYMGQQNLKHKILAIAEEEGVAQASYALKLLQSDGQLRIAAAGKNSGSGRQQTESYEVEGPVMMFLTTTAEHPDVELQNRCLTLHVNESPEQTAAIHTRQRLAYTPEGQAAESQRNAILKLHQNAQRLLQPLRVEIPWAAQLQFRHDQTRMRRDHVKYLSLIASITLLHQHQRTRTTRTVNGEELESLVATIEDGELAQRLASEVLGQSLDGLLPQTRQLLVLIDDYVNHRSQSEKKPRGIIRFTQRALREALGWGEYQLRRHLARLIELEYVLSYHTSAKNQREYQLLYDGQGRAGEKFVLGLADLRSFNPEPEKPAASNGGLGQQTGHRRGSAATAATASGSSGGPTGENARSAGQNDGLETQNDGLEIQNDAPSMPRRSAFDGSSMTEKNGVSRDVTKGLRRTNGQVARKKVKSR